MTANMVSSVAELVQASCQRRPETIAVEILGDVFGRITQITYHELAWRISKCSQAFLDLSGKSIPSKFCEQCMAIVSSDCVESIILQLALMELGLSFILILEDDVEDFFR